MQRRVSGLVAVSLLAVVGAVPAAAAPCARAAAARSGGWFDATPPLRPEEPRDWIRGTRRFDNVAVDPGNPLTLVISDTKRVLRSADGGCTWTVVYELPAVPGNVPERQLGQITSVDVARVAGRTRVLLAIRTNQEGTTANTTVVVRSDDGYSGWTPVFDSLGAGVTPSVDVDIEPVVRSAGEVAYAVVPSARFGTAYVRSGDGGRTWTVRTPFADQIAHRSVDSFTVNPWHPDELWDSSTGPDGHTSSSLRRSTDGGISWTEVDPWPAYHDDSKPRWYRADVRWPRRGAPARILILGRPSDPKAPWNPTSLGTWSGDGGRTFRVLVPPHGAYNLDLADVASVGTGDAIVVAPDRQAWRIPHLGRPVRGSEWRRLPRAPHSSCLNSQGCYAAGSPAVPGVVMVPAAWNLMILAVPR